MAFASKTAFATILLGFLFVGWGGASLQAQERKTGWFVGISPYAIDLNLEKTARQRVIGSVLKTSSQLSYFLLFFFW